MASPFTAALTGPEVMAEFVMPALGADMEAGRLIAWMKKPGDRIERGEIIAEIDTDKGLIEVECFATGVVEKLLINPGDKVPVGTVLAIIREEGRERAAEAIPAITTPAPPPETARLKISPVAKKMAAELGIDPATITGTGPGGRITHEDVERVAATRAAEAKVAPPVQPDEAAARAARMRQAIAAAMAKSKREIPHYYLSATLLYSVIFILIYAAAMRTVFIYEKRRIAELAEEMAEAAQLDHISKARAFTMYAVNAALVIGAATWLPHLGERIAEMTGLGRTFVGNVFIAVSTSLPELVVSFAALRIVGHG
jgi:pyruvate dehydrogenase E2 component (dihydrolipoamide acetyltransferase)